MYKAIVFDLFQTLVDPRRFKAQDTRPQNLLGSMLQGRSDEFKDYWARTATLRNRDGMAVRELFEGFARRSGLTISDEFIDLGDYVLGIYEDRSLMAPSRDTLDTLSSLRDRGFKLGLLSNADEREVRAWPVSPLAEFFDAVSFSYQTGYEKPDAKAYAQVLKDMSEEDPSLVVFVGDGVAELVGAKDFGFGLVVAARGFRPEVEQASGGDRPENRGI